MRSAKDMFYSGCTILLSLLLLAPACNDPAGPEPSGEPVLSLTGSTHFHCSLSWTPLSLKGYEHESYHLYRSESPGIASDTSGAVCVVSFQDVGDVEHADSTVESGTGYYYALLTRMNDGGRGDSHLWSNECSGSTVDVINVTVQNHYGSDVWLIVQQAPPIENPHGTIWQFGGPWLWDIGPNSLWSGDATGGDSTFNQRCQVSIPADADSCFVFPDYTGFGCRMYVGTERAFTGKPDLATYGYIYDKIEMGSISNSASWNTTCVDFVGIPMQIELHGVRVGFNNDVTRKQVMDALTALTYDPYPNLRHPTTGTILRFFSLVKLPTQYSLNDCFGDAIELGLPLLETAASGIAISYGESSYSDIRWDAESRELTASSGTGTVIISDIDTEHAVGNTITFSSGGAELAGMIGAAVHRGVLYDPMLWGSFEAGNPGYPGNYYVEHTDNDSTFDRYAGILHSLSIDSICYAQSYDDYFHQDPSLTPVAGDTITITILPEQ